MIVIGELSKDNEYRFWVHEHCLKYGNDWIEFNGENYAIYWFKNEDDALAFRLTFGL